MDSLQIRRFRQSRELFERCVGLAPPERQRVLDASCHDRPALRREVERLLEQHEHADDRFGEAVRAAAASMVGSAGLGDDEPGRCRLEPGQLVAHYEVEALIGRGGMGEIYSARDLRLDRRLALKVLSSGWNRSGDGLRRLRREANSLAALNHPNVVTLYSLEECDETPILALELVEGTTLRDRLREGPLTGTAFFSTARQLAAGLAAAHADGLLHRDLKPDNVMITTDGLVKILDFGLARPVAPADSVRGPGSEIRTVSGAILGTMPYMSPEQVEGKPTDSRSDVFSLGCVLYEMCAGTRPFQGDSDSAVIAAVLRDDPEDLKTLCPDLPTEVAEVVRRSLDKKPARRFADAREVHDALCGCAPQPWIGPASSPPDGLRASRDRLPRRWLALASIAILLVCVGAAVWALRTDVRLVPAIDTTPLHSDVGPSIAVLPMRLVHPVDDGRILARGLSESVSETLATAGSVVVAAPNSVRRFADSGLDARSFAEELNVDTVLTGALDSVAGSVHLDLELLDVESGRRLWTRSLERSRDELPRMIDEVARDLAVELNLRLATSQPDPTVPSRRPDGAAYLEYIRGRHYWDQRTSEGYERAIQAFRRALDLDPTFARAYVGLADATAFRSVEGVSSRELYDRAITIVQQALDIDPKLAEAHATLAMLVQNRDLDFERAEAGYRRALELNPRYGSAHHWYGELLGQLGRFDEARHHFDKALEVDPLSSAISSDLGQLLFHARRFDEAIDLLERTARSNPSFSRTYRYLSEVHDELGQHHLAIDDLEQAWSMERFGPDAARARAARLRTALEQRGPSGYRQERLALDVRDDPAARGWEARRAMLHAAVGDRQGALNWLERALANNDWDLLFLAVHPGWDDLRKAPRFQVLLRELGLPGEA